MHHKNGMREISLSHEREPPRPHWPPEPGFFSMRLVRKGWPVPCRIACDDGLWTAEVDTTTTSHLDPVIAGADLIWHHAKRITEAEYRYLVAIRDTAPPDHPARNPRQPIRPATLTPLALPTTPPHLQGI
jgi:hypothetical protein